MASVGRAAKTNLLLYSKTSIARTRMARLPWLIRTCFCPYEILPIAPEIKYLSNFCYFIMKLYITICFLTCTMINPQWLALPMSRTNSMVPTMFEPLKFVCNYWILLSIVIHMLGNNFVLSLIYDLWYYTIYISKKSKVIPQ